MEMRVKRGADWIGFTVKVEGSPVEYTARDEREVYEAFQHLFEGHGPRSSDACPICRYNEGAE